MTVSSIWFERWASASALICSVTSSASTNIAGRPMNVSAWFVMSALTCVPSRRRWRQTPAATRPRRGAASPRTRCDSSRAVSSGEDNSRIVIPRKSLSL